MGEGKNLAAAAGAASKSPTKLLTISKQMNALADRFEKLGMDAPNSELAHLLWDISDGEQSMAYAVEDFATASQDGDVDGMQLANEDVAAAREQTAAALNAYTRYASTNS